MPGEGTRFKKGEGGRKPGSKNKKTLILERVYQRCLAKDFHPADVLIELALDTKAPATFRKECCLDLLRYMEGHQPESKPLIPNTTADSVKAAQDTMRELEDLSKPLEPSNRPAA